jgi:hypothetical protein
VALVLPGAGLTVRTTVLSNEHIQHMLLVDSAGNAPGTTNLANGRGYNVVVLNESACKGVDLIGDNLTGAMPVYVGAYATTSVANATYLTDNVLAPIRTTGDGRLVGVPYTVPEDQLATTPVTFTATTNLQLLPLVAVDQKIALIGALIVNTSATNTSLILKSGGTPGGTDGTVIGEIPVPAAATGVAPSTWPVPLRTLVNVPLMGALRAAATSVIVTPLAYRTKG